MRKLHSSAQEYIGTLRGRPLSQIAQNGIGYNLPEYSPSDSFLDITKSIGSSYLGSKMFHDAYYTDKYPKDPEEAKKRAQQAAITSGVLGGVRSIFSQIKENRDYQFEQDRIRKLQAKNYYRLPVDNYSYNENLVNPYNNTGYKNGGAIGKKKCQTGGLLDTLLPDQTRDTFSKYGQPTVIPAKPMDAYSRAFKDSLPGVDLIKPELRQEFNILDASARLNVGLAEQTSTKSLSKPVPFRERKYGGWANMYQDGGVTGSTDSGAYVQAATEVFDSTDPGPEYTSRNDSYFTSAQDELPMNDSGQGYDLSKFTPTLGGAPLNNNFNASSVQGVIDQIAIKESGGRYDIVNTKGGSKAIFATGKYQFVPKYWHKQIAEFQGTQGRSMQETMEHFRQSPQTQDAFMQHVVSNVYMPAVKRMLPLARAYGLGQNELIKMIHYRGISDTEKRLQTGNFKVSASEKSTWNNPDILSYIKN